MGQTEGVAGKVGGREDCRTEQQIMSAMVRAPPPLCVVIVVVLIVYFTHCLSGVCVTHVVYQVYVFIHMLFIMCRCLRTHYSEYIYIYMSAYLSANQVFTF